MSFQIEHFVSARIRSRGNRFLQQLAGSLVRVIPITEGNVQTKSRERRADFGCRAREPLSRSIDPNNSILRMSRFTITVDDVQVSSVDSFAIWIFVEVHDVPRRSFIAAA